MKRLLIGDHREKLLITLETVLRHWGYRVLVSSRVEALQDFIEESPPDLLVLGARFYRESPAEFHRAVSRQVESGHSRLILLEDENPGPLPSLPHDLLETPIDVFDLFELIQKYMQKYPRKNLRLTTQLPGMLCLGDSCQLADVVSLSVQGLFIKTSFRLDKDDQVKIVIPLLGMKRELEIEGRVLYRVNPDPENNYLQGLGLEFSDLPEADREALEIFVEKLFMGELTTSHSGRDDLSPEELRDRSGKAVLKII